MAKISDMGIKKTIYRLNQSMSWFLWKDKYKGQTQSKFKEKKDKEGSVIKFEVQSKLLQQTPLKSAELLGNIFKYYIPYIDKYIRNG